jgi:hypothetical protein
VGFATVAVAVGLLAFPAPRGFLGFCFSVYHPSLSLLSFTPLAFWLGWVGLVWFAFFLHF